MVPASDLPAAPNGVVREDWYFRESLTAIDDWETLLTRLDADKSSPPLAACLPVPADGRPVRWPNPIPQRLLPHDGSRAATAGAQRGRPSGTPTPRARGRCRLGDGQAGSGGCGLCASGWWGQGPVVPSLRSPVRPAAAVSHETRVLVGRMERPRRISNSAGTRYPSECTTERTGLWNWMDGWTSIGLPCPPLVPSQRLVVPVGQTQTLTFPLVPDQSRGRTGPRSRLSAGGDTFCLPLLTHVEHVGAVLKSVEQILAETPDPLAAGQLGTLKGRVRAWADTASAEPGNDRKRPGRAARREPSPSHGASPSQRRPRRVRRPATAGGRCSKTPANCETPCCCGGSTSTRCCSSNVSRTSPSSRSWTPTICSIGRGAGSIGSRPCARKARSQRCSIPWAWAFTAT